MGRGCVCARALVLCGDRFLQGVVTQDAWWIAMSHGTACVHIKTFSICEGGICSSKVCVDDHVLKSPDLLSALRDLVFEVLSPDVCFARRSHEYEMDERGVIYLPAACDDGCTYKINVVATQHTLYSISATTGDVSFVPFLLGRFIFMLS